MAPLQPRLGPCNPWVLSSDIAGQPDCGAIPAAVLALAATYSSNVLYRLSGKEYTGSGCGPVTERPVWRPHDSDERMLNHGIGNFGTAASYGFAGSDLPTSFGGHFGAVNPAEVELSSYPVNAVSLVKIDGVVIPPAEYYIQDYRTLVRVRIDGTTPPTERYGWPSFQRIDLPDTQPGTFSVTYTYGRDVPEDGKLAAMVLGAELAKAQAGMNSALPRRVTSIMREGVSMTVLDSHDFLEEGRTGLYEVDLFLKSVNPNKNAGRAQVWSPDIGRSRRLPTGGYR